MKKLFAFLVSAILLCGVCILPVSAASNGNITISSASAKQGDSVTLNVNMPKNPGLVTMTIKVTYDTNVLELTNVSDPKLLIGSQLNTSYGSPYTISWVDGSATSNNTKTGKIASFTFKIKSNAKIGTSNVNLEFVDSFDTNYAENNFTATSGKVTVLCKTHSYGAYTNANSTQHKRTCTACGNVETVNHTWNSGTVTKQATCKDTGTKHFTCTACNATKDETIAKTANHKYGSWSAVKAASCTAAGSQERACTVCGKKETESIAVTGHSYGGWTTAKQADCTNKGTKTRTCSKCGNTETKEIAALGHSFSHPTVTKEPTCTESGTETGKCTRCGKETTQTIESTGHKFSDWKAVKAATCTEDGTEERACTKCDIKETRNTAALGHDFENPTVVKESTISTEGLSEGKCKRCGQTTQQIIPCTVSDEKTGIKLETEKGVFAEGTEVKIEKTDSASADYSSAKNILSEISNSFELYTVDAILNGASVQPNGEVKISFNIPDGYGKNAELYYITEDGKSEKQEYEISADAKVLGAKISKFGKYAICKSGDVKSGSDNSETLTDTTPKANNNTLLWIIIAAATVIIAGVVITVLVIKKKKT